jgi:hypothetical protein
MAAHKRGKVGGMRPGAGRKPKPRDEKQGRLVTLALTEAEYAALREAAGEEPLATAARRFVTRALARRRRK